MPDKKTDDNALVVPGKKHGLYSWVRSKRLPRGRAFQKVRRELGHLRDELVEAHGGEALTPDARILVDSVIEGLGVQKLMGLHIREYGVIDKTAAKEGQLDLSPLLAKHWVSYANVVRQGLLALKEIDKGRPDREPDILTFVAEFDKEKAAREALSVEERAGIDVEKAPGNSGEGEKGDEKHHS